MPSPDQPPIAEPPVRGGLEAQHAHRLLERERACRAPHPVAQEVRLERGVHDLRDVRARVREGDHRSRMLDQLERVVLVLVGDRLEEEPLEILLEGQVDHRLDRIDSALARNLGHRAVRALGGIHDEGPLVRGRARLGADRAALVALACGGDQTAAHLGVRGAGASAGRAASARISRHTGQAIERQAGLEREHDRERAAVDLGEHPAAAAPPSPRAGRGRCARGRALHAG